MTPSVALFPEEVVAGIGAGTYTEIVEIVAPSSAVAGSRVDITVKIKNLYPSAIGIMVRGALDYGITPWPTINFPDNQANVPGGATWSFAGYFYMPDSDVKIHAYSYYYAEGAWYFDDEKTKDVKLGEVVGWQLLDTRLEGVGAILPEVGWQPLDSRTVAVKSTPPPVVGWQPLDSRTVAIKSVPPMVGWQILDSKTTTVKSGPPTVVGWQLLDEKTVSLAAGPPAVPWELVYEHEYPRGKTYVGKAEECTATLTIPLPDQLFPNNWVIEKIADTFADEVAKEGGEMLDIKIYEDATPTWHTDYKIVATAITSPFPWAIVIPLILAIILVVAFITLVVQFKDIDWGEIPAPIPWAILALAGGLAVAGAGVAFALSRPKAKE